MSKIIDVPEETGDAIYPEEFRYLRVLRESGGVNMFAAAPFLAQMFGYPVPEAREILQLWMERFHGEDA